MPEPKTTLAEIRKHHPCGIDRNATTGYRRLVNHLGPDHGQNDPVPLSTILESNGLDDALWCLRALPPEWGNAVRLLVCDLVEPAMAYTDDPRPAKALEVARRYARGAASGQELAAARDAAWAAGDAAGDAAWAAAGAAPVAADVAAAWAARDAARDEQERIFRAWLTRMSGPKKGGEDG